MDSDNPQSGSSEADFVPKVFVSYSWAGKARAKRIADLLRTECGVDVVIDIYHLKPGQNKYAFMQRIVDDASIDRVLVLCDQACQERANNFEGGVGDEATIISPKIYKDAKQTKISNPGGLFGRVKPENFPFVNDYRNPLLAEAMKVLGFVNKYNRGIAKVNRELEKNGNQPPQFDVNKKTEFRVTLIAKALVSGMINLESGTINPGCGTINPGSGTINSKSGMMNGEESKTYDIKAQDKAVLELIEKTPGIKREGIFLEVKTSLRTVARVLQRLVDAGKIEYRGSKRTGGWYVRT